MVSGVYYIDKTCRFGFALECGLIVPEIYGDLNCVLRGDEWIVFLHRQIWQLDKSTWRKIMYNMLKSQRGLSRHVYS